MSSFKSINDALNTLSTENDSAPLLSEEDILKALRTNTVSLKRSGNVLKYSILSITLAVATVATVLFLPQQHDTRSGRHSTDAKHSLNQDAWSAASDKAPLSSASDSQSLPDVKTKSQPALHPLPLSASDLTQLGLKLHTSYVSYSDQGFRIMITTNGISVRGSHSADAVFVPKHVTLYRSNKIFASWFDAGSEIDVNQLVAVRLHIVDANNTVFPAADVVLWYEPTPEFIDALPANLRQSVLNELTNVSVSAMYTLKQAENTTITESRIFPNPAYQSLATVSFKLAKECTTSAALYDALGNKVVDLWTSMHHASGIVEMPIQNLDVYANGMYLVVVEVEGISGQVVQRLLIEH